MVCPLVALLQPKGPGSLEEESLLLELVPLLLVPELPSLLEEPLLMLEEASDALELLPEAELELASEEEASEEELLLLLLSLRRFLLGLACFGLSSSNSSEGAR